MDSRVVHCIDASTIDADFQNGISAHLPKCILLYVMKKYCFPSTILVNLKLTSLHQKEGQGGIEIKYSFENIFVNFYLGLIHLPVVF